MGITDDEQDDCFIDSNQIRQAQSELFCPVNARDFSAAIQSCSDLKRFKLGYSLMDFVLETGQYTNRDLLHFVRLISAGYVYQSITLEEGKKMIQKLLPEIQKLPPQLSNQLLETAHIFLDNKKEVENIQETPSSSIIPEESMFISLISHAIRQRNLQEFRKLATRFPDFSVYDTPMLDEWFKWVEEVPAEASELVQIFLDLMSRNYYQPSIDFKENFIQRFNRF